MFRKCHCNILLWMKELQSSMAVSKKMEGIFLWLLRACRCSLACLGLFGLSIFVVKHKIKDKIGIRKVLGASVGGIKVTLLSKDFLKLVLLAVLIAFPLAWYFMDNWIKEFAYHINISYGAGCL